jgi:hypothetical protein
MNAIGRFIQRSVWTTGGADGPDGSVLMLTDYECLSQINIDG